jgi:hypothetical protein
MTYPCYIFDIDGTLADGSHRQHLIRTKPKSWTAYRRLAHTDLPIAFVVQTLKLLAQTVPCFIVSGRMEEERHVTIDWLARHGIWQSKSTGIGDYENLFMRPTNDHREDSIIKSEILNNKIRPEYEPIAVFDDRNRVVKMWRAAGIPVFNVNQTSLGDEF